MEKNFDLGRKELKIIELARFKYSKEFIIFQSYSGAMKAKFKNTLDAVVFLIKNKGIFILRKTF